MTPYDRERSSMVYLTRVWTRLTKTSTIQIIGSLVGYFAKYNAETEFPIRSFHGRQRNPLLSMTCQQLQSLTPSVEN